MIDALQSNALCRLEISLSIDDLIFWSQVFILKFGCRQDSVMVVYDGVDLFIKVKIV